MEIWPPPKSECEPSVLVVNVSRVMIAQLHSQQVWKDHFLGRADAEASCAGACKLLSKLVAHVDSGVCVCVCVCHGPQTAND